MDNNLLRTHIKKYVRKLEQGKITEEDDLAERSSRKASYQSWTPDRISAMSEDDLYGYLSQLWAMRIWGNKHYIVDKIIREIGLAVFKKELSELIWGNNPTRDRWDRFRDQTKHVGPAMMSELLCHVHPSTCMLWNRRSYVAFRYLGVESLPRYDYQHTGKKYEELSQIALEIGKELKDHGAKDSDLLAVDYFIWNELQVEDTLAQIHRKPGTTEESLEPEEVDTTTSTFVHNEIRDKLADIGQWLGFRSETETRVAEGSRVDTIWEATIGNLGRVIYVFEVQTAGSVDSLLLNLLKSLNSPAVQGVVAVSDSAQLVKIRKQATTIQGLGDKLKYWDYQEILTVHAELQSVNEAINKLGLVPESF